MNLILPCCGLSTRFPDLPPKYMLKDSDGVFMLEHALSGISLNFVKKVTCVVLKEHVDSYRMTIKTLQRKLDINWIILDFQTMNQPDTIYQGLLNGNIRGPIFVKDCDSHFRYEPSPKNGVCYALLANNPDVISSNKSYIACDGVGVVTNIVEKQVISDKFCVGGYLFENANEFIANYIRIDNTINSDLYVSNIIYEMMLDDTQFIAEHVNEYKDYGDLESWEKHV